MLRGQPLAPQRPLGPTKVLRSSSENCLTKPQTHRQAQCLLYMDLESSAPLREAELSSSCGGLGPFGPKGDFAGRPDGRTDERTDGWTTGLREYQQLFQRKPLKQTIFEKNCQGNTLRTVFQKFI